MVTFDYQKQVLDPSSGLFLTSTTSFSRGLSPSVRTAPSAALGAHQQFSGLSVLSSDNLHLAANPSFLPSDSSSSEAKLEIMVLKDTFSDLQAKIIDLSQVK